MKNMLLTMVLILASYTAFAGTCGSGKIVMISEGGWDTNGYMVKIDYSKWPSVHIGTEFNGYVVYKNTLNAQRLTGIKALALAAYMSGKTVSTFSHVDNCSEATAMSIYDEL